jgi:hypothetical protein
MTTYFVVEISGKVNYGEPSWDENGRHIQERTTTKSYIAYHSPSYVSQTPQMYRTKGLAEAVIKKNREYKLLAEYGLCRVVEVELKVVGV